MATNYKLHPPAFGGKTYELYKIQLEAWDTLTDVPDQKKGLYIAMNLPDKDPSQIKEKVFEQVGIAKLNIQGGLKVLVKFMDEQLLKDSLEDAWSKYFDFEEYARSQSENMNTYIQNFELKYERTKAKNMTLPSTLLAFKLLKGARISREERLLVMSGINTAVETTMFEDAKSSLKKFKGNSMGILGKEGHSQGIKLEPGVEIKQEVLFTRRPVNRYSQGSYSQAKASQEGGAGSTPRGSRVEGEKNLNPVGRDGKLMKCSKCTSIRHLFSTCPHKFDKAPKTNPMGRNGKQLLCDSCDSTMHFVRTCPHRWEALCAEVGDEYDEYEELNRQPDEVSVALFTGKCEDVKVLGKESVQMAVLDSACASTVAGRGWYDDYKESLSEEDRKKVIVRPGEKVYKFGGKGLYKSVSEVEIPAHIGTEAVMIKADIVESDIPLLLSRPLLKEMKCHMDYENDQVDLLDQTLQMDLTSSGHYCISVGNREQLQEVNLVELTKLDEGEATKQLVKLHRQFGHPSKIRFRHLLEDAGAWKSSFSGLLDSIYSGCKHCLQYKVTSPRPVVCMPMARQFNDVVAMDLKEWGKGSWILYLVDMFSRYTMAIPISTKISSGIIDKIIINWVKIFGIMGTLLCDNGGEFASLEMAEVTSILNIKYCTTGAESPFQNGLCERNHAICDNILTGLQADFPESSLDVLASWACMSKNSLQMICGFSSNQLVFGVNPRLPNVMEENVAALEGSTMSEVLAKHLNILHESRKAFIRSESEERIRRALRAKIRTSEQVLVPGDKVFYKRDNQRRWLGPGSVLGQDGKIIFIRHGGFLIRASANRVLDANKIDFKEEQGGSLLQSSVPESTDDDSSRFHLSHESPVGENAVETVTESSSSSEAEATETLSSDESDPGMAPPVPISPVPDFDDHPPPLPKTPPPNKLPRALARLQDHNNPGLEEALFSDVATGSSTENVHQAYLVECDLPSYVFMSEVPRELHDSPECLEAKKEELAKLDSFGVYNAVPDTGQVCISTKWVVTYKGDKIKARIVARGFQERQSVPSDSPTVAKTAFRCTLAIAARNQWTIKSTDIKSAFLQGQDIDRDVFLKPPKEANVPPGVIWKLNKSLYGLHDGARQFYLSLKEELLRLGCVMSSVEPSLFFYFKEGKLSGVLVSHIDDFLHAGDESFEHDILQPLGKRFLPGRLEEREFKYVGFNVVQDDDGISISMTEYVDKHKEDYSRCKSGTSGSQLSATEQQEFRQVVGRLNWVVQGTRPDKFFEVIDLSMKLKQASTRDLNVAKQTFLRLAEFESSIRFIALQGELWLSVYTDAALGNLSDGVSSTCGVLVFLVNRFGVCPISWRSNKIQRVVTSTLAAETLALQVGINEAIYLRHLMCEMMPEQDLPIDVYVDNRSVVDAIRSTKLVSDRRLRIDIAALKQTLECIRKVIWVPGSEQLANCLTKKGASSLDLMEIFRSGKLH